MLSQHHTLASSDTRYRNITEHERRKYFVLQVDEMYREAPIKNGMFDYNEFTKILKHGAKEKDEP